MVAELAPELSTLDLGVGGPEALHSALAPLKQRLDLTLGLALIGQDLSPEQILSVRTDFAERVCETALGWLIRSAIRRGEPAWSAHTDQVNARGAAAILPGLFMLAGGNFAHQETAIDGPLDLVLAYDPARVEPSTHRGLDQSLTRIGAELRAALEGSTGDQTLYRLNTPFGNGINGAGFAESTTMIGKTLANPEAREGKRWLATARIVAGDRAAGGDYLESIENHLWQARPLVDTALLSADLKTQPDEPLSALNNNLQAIIEVCRLSLGQGRPAFRTLPARDVLQAAASTRVIPPHLGSRLQAILDSRDRLADMIALIGLDEPHHDASASTGPLAALMGFETDRDLKASLAGLAAESASARMQVLYGPRRAFERYHGLNAGAEAGDEAKLEALGFPDGAHVAALVERWMSESRCLSPADRAARDQAEHDGSDADATPQMPTRFSARAPGLLTAFGETQYPQKAIRLFDRILATAKDENDLFETVNADISIRERLVSALGCFPEAVAPLATSADGVEALLAPPGPLPEATPGAEARTWLGAHPSPEPAAGAVAIGQWRESVLARAALALAGGDIDFAAGAAIFERVHDIALDSAFEAVRMAQAQAGNRIGDNIAVFACAGEWQSLPGDRAAIGLVLTAEKPGDDDKAKAENFAEAYLAALESVSGSAFPLAVDLGRRPGGLSGPRIATLEAWRHYAASEAVAFDQISLARARMVAGSALAREAARTALREVVSNHRRTSQTLRDLDRARAQHRIRHNQRGKAVSLWDTDHREGTRLDLEMMINVLVYRHAGSHPILQIEAEDDALGALAENGLIDSATARSLVSARRFWYQLALVRGLSGWTSPQISPVRPRFRPLVARACGVAQLDYAEPILRGYGEEGGRLYAQIVLGRDTLPTVA